MVNLLRQYAGRITPEHTSEFRKQKLDQLGLLSDCPGMKDHARVKILMEMLPVDIKSHVSVRDSAADLLGSLFAACVDYALSMQPLFEALGFLLNEYAVHRAVRDVDWALRDILQESTVTRARRDEILDLFPNTVWPRGLHGLYRKATPAGPEVDEADRADLWSLLYALSQQPRDCVDRFLSFLHRDCRADLAAADLPDWLPSAWTEDLRARHAGQPQECARLEIEITRSEDGARFDFKFTMDVPDAAPISSSRFRDADRQTIEEELDSFLRDNAPIDRSPVLEFLVPPDLVGCRWDRLRIKMSDNEIAVGYLYHVVCRILGRDRRTYSAWRDRWGYFHGFEREELLAEREGRPPRWIWVAAKTDDAGRFIGPECSDAQFLQRLLQAGECALAAFDLLPLETGDLCKYLSKAAMAGLPILVGRLSYAGAERTLKAEITSLLEAGHRELPKGVMIKRVDGMNDESHWANHTALIWDDPARVPELARPPR